MGTIVQTRGSQESLWLQAVSLAESEMRMKRRDLARLAGAGSLALLPWMTTAVWAADEAPDALITRLSKEVLDLIKADKAVQAGDTSRIMALVDSKIMPNVNFQRMTALSVGPAWRQATVEQRQRLQDEF